MSTTTTDITEALKAARYNECVVITVNEEEPMESSATTITSSSSSREIILMACLDELNGGITWNDITTTATATTSTTTSSTASTTTPDDCNTASSSVNTTKANTNISLSRHLQTKRWIYPMLNDVRRNVAYNQAIHKACTKLIQKQRHVRNVEDKKKKSNTTTTTTTTNSINVLDIGTGTGLLAMMATKHLQNEVDKHYNNESSKEKIQVNVTSLEMSNAMARLAKLNIKSNNPNVAVDQIQVLEGVHSFEYNTTYDETKFHLCTSELLETGLLGEGWLPTVRDLYNRKLLLHDEDAIVIPQRATVYAQLVTDGVEGSAGGSDNDHDDDDDNFFSISQFWGPHHRNHKHSSDGIQKNKNDHDNDDEVLYFPFYDRHLKLSLSSNDQDVMLNSDNSSAGASSRSDHADVDVADSLLEGVHVPLHATELLKSNKLRVLSKPLQVLQIDVSSKDTIPPAANGLKSNLTTHTFEPISSGVALGVLFWWDLDLWKGDDDDKNDKISYSTQPLSYFDDEKSSTSSLWQDHWHQCLYVFAKPKMECPKLVQGTISHLFVSHDDSKIYFSIISPNGGDDDDETTTRNQTAQNHQSKSPLPTTNEPDPKRLRIESHQSPTKLSSLITSDRACQLNDLNRIRKLRAGIEYAVSKFEASDVDADAVVLDLSDFCLCAMIAALCGASCVSSLETSSGEIPITSARVAQIANGLPIPATSSNGGNDNVFVKENTFQIVQCHAEQLSLDILGGHAANIVVAEPYYEILEGWHLQEALNYFYLLRALKNRGIISGRFISIPSCARVMGCAIQANDLASAYKGCDTELMGFNHDVINQYGNRFSEYDLSLPMWNYDYVVLSDEVELVKIDYGTCEIINNKIWVDSTFQKVGTCHAMLSWIEYVITNGREGKNCVISTKTGTSFRQIVRMLPEAVSITEDDIKGGTKLSCRTTIGGLLGPDDHQFEIVVNRNGADDC